MLDLFYYTAFIVFQFLKFHISTDLEDLSFKL